MTESYNGRVAIVTGAGNGLGCSHALELARRGAKVVVNDIGGSRDGKGSSSEAAINVVHQIKELGGDAISHGANVTCYDQVENMVEQAMAEWGRVDILINNAGILRDKSFAKMDIEDFKTVIDVHLFGAANCTKAVWDIMRKQNYGRVVMTTSSTGLYGNFGQANYGAAKMAMIGLMNTLALEGEKYNILVNALAPMAGTRMTEDLIPKNIFDVLKPEPVTAAALALCHSKAPNQYILCAGAGVYTTTRLLETEGIFLDQDQQTPENIISLLDEINESSAQSPIASGPRQTEKILKKVMAHTNLDLIPKQ